MGGATAFLAGKKLAGSVSWGLTAGVRPFTAVVTLKREDADALLQSGPVTGSDGSQRPVELRLGSGGRARTFEGIYILHRAPGPSPYVAALTIADRRWLWPNATYRRFLNVHRKVGTQRLRSPAQLDPLDLEPKFNFARWSLKGKERRWTAKELLEDLAAAITSFETNETGVTPRIEIPTLADDAGLPIQDLELDGELDACIERALAYLPGLEVTVTATGVVRFFWRTDESEMTEVRAARAPIQGRGYIEPIDFRRVRPRKIRVYFNVEAELAFRADDDDSVTTDQGPDALICTNVLPVPDPSLTLRTGATVTTGTYVTFPEAFAAWGLMPGAGIVLDKSVCCAAFVPYQNLWNSIIEHGATSPAANWAARVAAVQAHFRQTFRINPAWVDRISELRPYRVATINTETGTRGAASVFSDFAYVPSMRTLIAELLNNGSVGYVVNVACYPSNDVVGTSTIAAPATVTVEDPEQGVFTVTYHADPIRMYEMALPSQVELAGDNTQPGTLVAAGRAGPSPFLRRHNRPLAFNVLGQYHDPPRLTRRHKLIAIMTAVPASPNGKGALCYVDILPHDVPAFAGQAACQGPMLEIHIGGALETARVAWIDSKKNEIQQFFTQETQDPGPNESYALASLVVNYTESNGGAASLTTIGRAAAARIWHALRDRGVGSATYGFRGDAEVRGAISGVRHELAMSGALTTSYDLPGRVEPLSLKRFLDATALRIVDRIINPGK